MAENALDIGSNDTIFFIVNTIAMVHAILSAVVLYPIFVSHQFSMQVFWAIHEMGFALWSFKFGCAPIFCSKELRTIWLKLYVHIAYFYSVVHLVVDIGLADKDLGSFPPAG